MVAVDGLARLALHLRNQRIAKLHVPARTQRAATCARLAHNAGEAFDRLDSVCRDRVKPSQAFDQRGFDGGVLTASNVAPLASRSPPAAFGLRTPQELC